MLFIEKNFNKLFVALCSFLFVIVCLRAWLIPLSHDEAATFFYYVQSNDYLPFKAHVYTNNHVLNSALANLFYHIAGSHRFVLRLPNVLAFIVFCYGIYRHFRHFNTIWSKLITVLFLLLTFNLLDFFELCRGYGLSLGFMMLGLSYLSDYLKEKNLKSFRNFSICWQIALAANLILVVVLFVIFLYVMVFQYRIKQLFLKKNIIIQSVNFALLLFWISLSLFYREKGVLDYGVGDDYWQVSFKSLINILYGTDVKWVQLFFVITAGSVFALFFYRIFRNSFLFDDLFKPEIAYPFLLLSFAAAFYVQKKMLNVNYPEDRTGLFFFLFYVISLAFFLEAVPAKISIALTSAVSVLLIINFAAGINFSNYSTLYYHTIPKAVYDKLMDEYEKTKHVFTLGGHRVRELNFAYLNYRGGAVLNPMDDAEEMQMNCDYYFAMRREKPYYDAFYQEIAYDRKWDRALLRRREKIEHQIVYETYKPTVAQGGGEFFDLKLVRDTGFSSHNPLEADVEIYFEKVPKPFRAFLVLSIDNEKGETVWYKRILLNWLAKDLNGQTKYLKLTTGNLPPKVGKLSLHIWNIEKKEVKVIMRSLRIYQLFGKGVDLRIPRTFYQMIENVTKTPLL